MAASLARHLCVVQGAPVRSGHRRAARTHSGAAGRLLEEIAERAGRLQREDQTRVIADARDERGETGAPFGDGCSAARGRGVDAAERIEGDGQSAALNLRSGRWHFGLRHVDGPGAQAALLGAAQADDGLVRLDLIDRHLVLVVTATTGDAHGDTEYCEREAECAKCQRWHERPETILGWITGSRALTLTLGRSAPIKPERGASIGAALRGPRTGPETTRRRARRSRHSRLWRPETPAATAERTTPASPRSPGSRPRGARWGPRLVPACGPSASGTSGPGSARAAAARSDRGRRDSPRTPPRPRPPRTSHRATGGPLRSGRPRSRAGCGRE